MDQPQGDAAEEADCRVCLETTARANLVCPCACSGTQAFVHESCLRKWQVAVLSASTSRLDRRAHICSVCNTPFSLSPPKPSMWVRFKRMWQERVAFALVGAVLLNSNVNLRPAMVATVAVSLFMLPALMTRSHFFMGFVSVMIIFIMQLMVGSRMGLRLGPFHFPWVEVEGLQAGVLLTSTNQIGAGIFHQSVVLITEHSNLGARGFVVNRIHNHSTTASGSTIARGLGGPVSPWITTAIHTLADIPGAEELMLTGPQPQPHPQEEEEEEEEDQERRAQQGREDAAHRRRGMNVDEDNNSSNNDSNNDDDLPSSSRVSAVEDDDDTDNDADSLCSSSGGSSGGDDVDAGDVGRQECETAEDGEVHTTISTSTSTSTSGGGGSAGGGSEEDEDDDDDGVDSVETQDDEIGDRLPGAGAEEENTNHRDVLVERVFLGGQSNHVVSRASHFATDGSRVGHRVLLVSGFAGWAPGQLETEMRLGAWRMRRATVEMIFSGADAWHTLQAEEQLLQQQQQQ